MWWRNVQVQQTLHLTSEQVARLEQIFDRDVGLRIARRQRLNQLETQFAEALETGDVNEIHDSHLIDRIEDLRTRINIRRSRMLFAMYRTLSADQRKALSVLYPPGHSVRP
jgi:Spy/CpxP family protein refolding chaperone